MLTVSETDGWNEALADFMASMGSNVPINDEFWTKLIENWVWASAKLVVVIPLVSKRLLKAEIEASVVRLRLAVW